LELENRAYFARLVGDRGDAYFAEFEERHRSLVDANEAGEALMCVVRDADGRLVGRMNLKDLRPEGAEIGYRVAEAAGGRGYATEALRQLLGMARDRGVLSVDAVALDSSAASVRVLRANGFVEVATEEVELNGTTRAARRYRRTLR
jgi:ribosomal-protein-alanine N-acetyltransferase